MPGIPARRGSAVDMGASEVSNRSYPGRPDSVLCQPPALRPRPLAGSLNAEIQQLCRAADHDLADLDWLGELLPR